MKHREQRKRKQRNPLDAIHDQSDVEEHLAMGWGGIWACSIDSGVGELLEWGEADLVVQTGVTCTSPTARVGRVGQ